MTRYLCLFSFIQQSLITDLRCCPGIKVQCVNDGGLMVHSMRSATLEAEKAHCGQCVRTSYLQ